MQASLRPMPDLAYDPHETLTAFQARQHRAYDAGRHALSERRIKVHLVHLYEALVRCVGANQYAWVGEARLAEEFGVDVATIKRWIAKLVQAGLIRRQRRFATTSLTFITAYDSPAPTTAIDVSEPTDIQPEPQTVHDADAFFASDSAPTFGAHLRPLNLKTDHLSPGGGSSSSTRVAGVDRTITNLLEQEGVTDFFLAAMLFQKPLDELKAVSTYLNRQRHVEDRPKLFAWLVSRGFGAQLLSGMHQRRRRQPSAQATDSQKYLSGELAYLIQGLNPIPAQPTPVPRDDAGPSTAVQAEPSVPALTRTVQRGSRADQPLHEGTQHEWARGAMPHAGDEQAPPHALANLWSRVQAGLAQRLPSADMETWITPTALAALDTEQAFIETPHIFARDIVADTYRDTIAAVLQDVTGKHYVVEIVIGNSMYST